MIEDNDPLENKQTMYIPPKMQFQRSLRNNCPSVDRALLCFKTPVQNVQHSHYDNLFLQGR